MDRLDAERAHLRVGQVELAGRERLGLARPAAEDRRLDGPQPSVGAPAGGGQHDQGGDEPGQQAPPPPGGRFRIGGGRRR
jgi:hypothetical protein